MSESTMREVCGLPVEFTYDEARRHWRFQVEAPRVSGSGYTTMDRAEEAASAAIDFALAEETR